MSKGCELDTPLSKESVTDMQEDVHIVLTRIWLVSTLSLSFITQLLLHPYLSPEYPSEQERVT